MSLKKPSWNEDSILRGAWRRVFTRSPMVIEFIIKGTRRVPRFCQDGTRAKVDSKEILCNVCGQWVKASLKGKNNFQVDHKVPVIDVNDISGKVKDWNEFKRRLFCEESNLQLICSNCHGVKTQNEKMIRQSHKDRVVLDALEEHLKSAWTIAEEKDLKKRVSKFLTKKKAPETKERALKLKEIIINKLKED